MSLFTTTVIKLNSNIVVSIIGFCMIQMSVFPLSILSSILENILEVILILFYFFKMVYFGTKLCSGSKAIVISGLEVVIIRGIPTQ